MKTGEPHRIFVGYASLHPPFRLFRRPGEIPFPSPVEVVACCQHQSCQDRDIKGTHDYPYLLPVDTHNVASIGQSYAPGERAQKCVNEELGQAHPGDTRREADKGAYGGHKSGEKSGGAAVFAEPSVGLLQVVVGNQYEFTIFF